MLCYVFRLLGLLIKVVIIYVPLLGCLMYCFSVVLVFVFIVVGGDLCHICVEKKKRRCHLGPWEIVMWIWWEYQPTLGTIFNQWGSVQKCSPSKTCSLSWNNKGKRRHMAFCATVLSFYVFCLCAHGTGVHLTPCRSVFRGWLLSRQDSEWEWHKWASRSVWSSLCSWYNQPERRLPLIVSLIIFDFQDHHHDEMLPIKASAPPVLWRWNHRLKQNNEFALLNFSAGPAAVFHKKSKSFWWSQSCRSESTMTCGIIQHSLWRPCRYTFY